jgi:pimeloyl-ACP methyl ester carboxylesterase
MRNIKRLIPVILVLVLLGAYFWPVPRPAPDQVYAAASPEQVASLQSFRAAYPPKSLEVGGLDWRYITVGDGPKTIVFLHGMTGSYDIWWQQMEALKGQYRLVSMTYPAAGTLDEMDAGLMAILDKEGVSSFYAVGTSLGGYFLQYLIARHPDRIEKAVLANTFPPNDLIKQKNGTIGALIPYLPEWLVMKVLSGSVESSIYPASKNDEMTRAFLTELLGGHVRKAQVAARYQDVVEKFEAPVGTAVPLMIIQASNDPLVEAALRQQLLETYPDAIVVTVDNGHFPYISTPDFYTGQLRNFFQG